MIFEELIEEWKQIPTPTRQYDNDICNFLSYISLFSPIYNQLQLMAILVKLLTGKCQILNFYEIQDLYNQQLQGWSY